MKKRQHTYQIDREISPISNLSQRSERGRTRGLRPAMVSTSTQAKPHPIASDWDDQSDYNMKLEDELSNNELKAFAFGCIESLTQLAGSDTNKTLENTLIKLTQRQLTTFVKLVNEHKDAQTEQQQYASWSKQFVATIQPLLNSAHTPSSEAGALNLQTVQCVERSMGAQFRVNALAERVSFLTQAIPNFVNTTGAELGFPKAITQKIADYVEKALSKIAS